MKRILLCLSIISSTFFVANSQTVIFTDDFDNGTSNWVLDGWDTTTTQAYNGAASLTDSKGGNYLNLDTTSATLATGLDLSGALDADLVFWAIYDIETGFDYMYVQASPDNGNTWTTIGTFNGEGFLTPWLEYTFSLGPFAGKPNVKIRFILETDQAYVVDGIYIDKLSIVTYNDDNSDPLIIHKPSKLYASDLNDQSIYADIIDIYGIDNTNLTYKVDNGAPVTVAGTFTTGNTYVYTIAAQTAGSWIKYWIDATDDSPNSNFATSDTFEIVSGNYNFYGTYKIDAINDVGQQAASLQDTAACKFALNGITDIVTGVIAIYTDYLHPIDSIEVHIWDDNAGIPGNDLIPPITIYPEATLLKPYKATKIDLRSYTQLKNVPAGEYWLGYTCDSAVFITRTNPGQTNRTFTHNGTSWTQFTNDYHMSLITDTIDGAPIADFSFNYLPQPDVDFTDLSLNNPTSWDWDFYDGNTSTAQNPTHTYTENGQYNVCLTATNTIESDQVCKLVTIDTILSAPGMQVITAGCPNITFLDTSSNFPNAWFWDFDDGNTSTQKNPTHNFIHNGTYDVCLTATTKGGDSTVCNLINITCNPPPVTSFSANDSTICKLGCVDFTDSSTGNSTSWLWTFPGGTPGSSTQQNPTVCYINAGTYDVELSVSGPNGSHDTTYSGYIIVDPCVGIEEHSKVVSATVFPNPAKDNTVITVNNVEQLANSTLQVKNLVGQNIQVNYTKKENSFNVSTANLSNGIYIFEVINSDKGVITTGKLTVKK